MDKEVKTKKISIKSNSPKMLRAVPPLRFRGVRACAAVHAGPAAGGA